MNFKQLPSPDALKRIMLMIGVQQLASWGSEDDEEAARECGFDSLCEWIDADILCDSFTLSYDPKKREYRYEEIPGGDEEFLHFAAGPDYCFVCSSCCEGGQKLPKEEIPAEIYNGVDEMARMCATLFAWSTDGKTWNKPKEGFDSSTFDETVLDSFLEDYPDFDEEQLRLKSPLWYQVYKQVPFDNDMQLEEALERQLTGNNGGDEEFEEEEEEEEEESPRKVVTHEEIAALELPQLSPAGTAQVLQYFLGYPTDLKEGYQPALTVEHLDELTAKGFYALAAYCVTKMAAKNPKDAALKQKVDEIYSRVQEVVATQKIYSSGEGGDGEDF